MLRIDIICLSVMYVVHQCARQTSGVPLQKQGLSLCDVLSNSGKNSVQCTLTKGDFLDYKEIRMWTQKEKDKYSVKISCNGGGVVFLPWPFVAQNVISLEVYGCALHGFLSEMTIKPAIQHELKTLILSSVSIDLQMNNMVTLQSNIDKIPLQTDCGPTSLHTLVLRDIHYDLKISPEERDKMTTAKLGASGKTKHAAPKHCVYPYLQYIDESGSRKSGSYYLKLIPEYSVFPVLEVYNMSNNNLDHVPDGFQRLHSKKFPVLKYVDFSNNDLKKFEFEFPKNLKSCNLEMLDLRMNHITTIPKNVVEQLKRLSTIMVDLRQNPLHCKCINAPFKQMLVSQLANSQDIRQRKLLSDVTCFYRDFKTGTAQDKNLLNFSFGKTCLT